MSSRQQVRQDQSYAGRAGSGTSSTLVHRGSHGHREENTDAPEEAAPDIPHGHDSTPWSAKTAFLIVFGMFVMALLGLVCIYLSLPPMDNSDQVLLKMPKDLKDAANVARVLSHYTTQYYYRVLSGITLLYIFLQTFAIPGSVFLSVISGSLFPWYIALLLICFCSATGATCCYFISYAVGRNLVRKLFPDRIDQWAQTVNHHRDNMTWYMIFLRITPFLPNWFINLTAPVIEVPVSIFYVGTFFGVIPPSLIAMHTGSMLHEYAATAGEPMRWAQLVGLGVFGFVALIPILFKNWLRERTE